MSSYAGKSQTTDTLCFKVEDVQKILIAAKQKKVQDTLINLLRSDITILQQQAAAWQGKDSVNREVIRLHQAQTVTYQQEVTLLKKEVRKYKNKTRWTAIAGVVVAIGTIMILK